MPVTINASTSSGLVQSADTSGQIELQTNGTTVATVNTSNNVQFRSSISVGNATPTTSGAGITFPATQSASTNANTLDDYEEGTFTPTVTPSGGSLTAYTSAGVYTKVGRIVSVYFTFSLTTVGTASGSATVGNLPFTTNNPGGAGANRAAIGIVREDGATGNAYQTYLNQSSTDAILLSLTNGPIVWTNGYIYDCSVTYTASA